MRPNPPPAGRWPADRCAIQTGSGRWRQAREDATLLVTAQPPDAATVRLSGELLHAHRGLRRMPSRIAVTALEPDDHLSSRNPLRRISSATPGGTGSPDLATVYRTVTLVWAPGCAAPSGHRGARRCRLRTSAPHHHAVPCGRSSRFRPRGCPPQAAIDLVLHALEQAEFLTLQAVLGIASAFLTLRA